MAVEGVMQNMTVGAQTPVAEVPQPTAAEVIEQSGAAEAQQAPPVEEKPKEYRSDRFAALARKEADLYRRQQAVRQQQAEIARRAEEVQRFNELKRQAALNPLDALKELGLSYEQITEYIMNDNKPTPSAEVMSLKQELEDFKRAQREEAERQRTTQREQIDAEQRQIVETFRSDVKDYIQQHADTYELTALYNGETLVSGVIEEYFGETGKLLTMPEAAKMVEEHFEELARKAQATKKFAATQPKAASPQVQANGSAPKLGPTLSNDLTARVASNPQRPRTDEDRIAAALARLEGR
jgi:hypothetical protein